MVNFMCQPTWLSDAGIAGKTFTPECICEDASGGDERLNQWTEQRTSALPAVVRHHPIR